MKRADPARVEGFVCIMGAMPDTGNRGVSALCNAVVKNVLASRPNARLAMFGGNRSSEVREVELLSGPVRIEMLNFRLSPRSGLKDHLGWLLSLALLHRIVPFRSLKARIANSHRVLHGLAHASFVGDIRGGDSFSDIYGLRRFLSGCLPYLVVLWLGKELVFLPQTIGPFRSRLAAGAARYVLRRASKVYCRDRESVEVAHSLRGTGSPTGDVSFCPDVAFTLDAIQPDCVHTIPPLDLTVARPLIGLNISGLLYEEDTQRRNSFGLQFDYRDFVAELIRRLLAETPAHVLLIPHTFGAGGGEGGDLEASRVVMAQARRDGEASRLSLLDQEYDASRLKWIIGQCDFFVGSRMHACIAAVSQGVPVAPVAYSRKFIGVFDSVELGDLVIDPRQISQPAAIEAVLAAFRGRDELRHRILPRIAKAQTAVRESFDCLFGNSCHRSAL